MISNSRKNSVLSVFVAWMNLLATIAWLAAPSPAQTNSTWSGGPGNWAPCPPQGNALWDTCPNYPDGNYNAIIDGGPVTLASGNGISVANLSLASGESLTITPGYLYITGSSIVNNGSISIGSGNGLDIQGNANVTLSGSGTVTLADPSAVFWGLNGSPTLVNQQTIQGQGSFSDGLNVTNQGTINANAGTLTMEPTSMTNTGMMEASSGSTLQLDNGTAAHYNNAGGTIEALNGGTVAIYNGIYTGGTLTTAGTGVIQANNSAVFNALTNSGTLQVAYASLGGAINNTGTIQVPSGTLFMSGNVTLSGKGSLVMSGTAHLNQLNGSDTLTSQQLIHGSGNIYELPLTNQGTISADSNGNTLTLQGETTTNTSTIEASGGGTLLIYTDATVANTGGSIEALDGSTVQLAGTVNGGTLTTQGSGTVQSQNGTLDGTINVPTNAGTLDVSGYSLFLQGTINNTGTIAVAGNSCVILNQATTLAGSGKVTMDSSSCIYGSGRALTNQSTIEGAGTIGDSNPMPITNQGTINANQSATLFIVPDTTGFTNTGTLIAGTGSTLTINGLFNNLSNGGTLTSGKYSVTGTLGFSGSVVTNAANITLSGAGAEVLDTSSGNNALATLATNAAKGVLSLQGGQVLSVATTLANKGTVTVGAGSGLSASNYTQTAGTTTVDGALMAAGLKLQKGTLLGKGAISASVTSSAVVTAGDSSTKAGVLSITGTYRQTASGILNIAIGGQKLGTQYSQLAVSNGASLNGTLDIKLVNSFVPAIGNTFTILTGSAISGKFSKVNGTKINGSEKFQVEYGSSAVTLKVVSGS